MTAFLLISLGLGACAKKQQKPSDPRPSNYVAGSAHCERACDYYMSCGGARAHGECVSECDFIFKDEEALRDVVALSCQDYLSYVDGKK